jgi:hypothetical protein
MQCRGHCRHTARKTGHGVDLVLTTRFEQGRNFGPIDLQGFLLEARPAVIDVAATSAFGQNNKRAPLLRGALAPIHAGSALARAFNTALNCCNSRSAPIYNT